MSVTASADEQETNAAPEVRPMFGAYLPTGKQEKDLKSAMLAGVQVATEVRPSLDLVGSFQWSPSKNKYLTAKNRVNLYQYDAGAELMGPKATPFGGSLKPFVGLGLGARTYHPQTTDLKSTTYFAGYGALGTEFQLSRVGLRLEGRDYLSQFKGVSGTEKGSTRNDVVLAAALAFHI
jgi:hypothetical protein